MSENRGVFLVKGTKLVLHNFTLRIDDDGNISSDVELQTGIDMCPHWVDIAYGHLLVAENIHGQLILAVKEKDDPQIGTLLHNEFLSGMQAIMTSCIALDSHYASVRNFVKIDADTAKAWRKNRTARYAQIAEIFRRCFNIPPKISSQVRDTFKQYFNLRNMAVHPNQGTQKPVLYPEISRVADWRYSAFRYVNAKNVVHGTLKFIHQTSKKGLTLKNKPLLSYCKDMDTALELTVSEWQRHFGEF